MVSCTTPGVADRSDTGPGTIQEHTHSDYVLSVVQFSNGLYSVCIQNQQLSVKSI